MMKTLVESLSRTTEIEYYFRPVKDSTGKFIDTGKTTQSGPDPSDKEHLFKHKAKVNMVSIFVKIDPELETYRKVAFSSYEIQQIYLKMKEIEKQESEEPLVD